MADWKVCPTKRPALLIKAPSPNYGGAHKTPSHNYGGAHKTPSSVFMWASITISIDNSHLLSA